MKTSLNDLMEELNQFNKYAEELNHLTGMNIKTRTLTEWLGTKEYLRKNPVVVEYIKDLTTELDKE